MHPGFCLMNWMYERYPEFRRRIDEAQQAQIDALCSKKRKRSRYIPRY